MDRRFHQRFNTDLPVVLTQLDSDSKLTGQLEDISDSGICSIFPASLEPGAVVSEVARRYGATPQQLFTWRREARRRAQECMLADGFVPVVVEAEVAGGGSPEPSRLPVPTRPHLIELDVAGTSVFIWRGAEPAMVSAIIGALKAAK